MAKRKKTDHGFTIIDEVKGSVFAARDAGGGVLTLSITSTEDAEHSSSAFIPGVRVRDFFMDEKADK